QKAALLQTESTNDQHLFEQIARRLVRFVLRAPAPNLHSTYSADAIILSNILRHGPGHGRAVDRKGDVIQPAVRACSTNQSVSRSALRRGPCKLLVTDEAKKVAIPGQDAIRASVEVRLSAGSHAYLRENLVAQ